jgi:hypothetical protein
VIKEWETDIQFLAGRSGNDKPQHEATYISQFTVEGTEENKERCLLRIYIIRTFLIIPDLRSMQLIRVIFSNVITTAQKTHCVSAAKTNYLILFRYVFAVCNKNHLK